MSNITDKENIKKAYGDKFILEKYDYRSQTNYRKWYVSGMIDGVYTFSDDIGNTKLANLDEMNRYVAWAEENNVHYRILITVCIQVTGNVLL
jgi:hypothetical protein